jgi:hypothetical protein
MYKELYVLVEGDNDERFVEWVVKPIIEKNYDYIGYYQYARRSKEKNEQFIRSLVSRDVDFFCLVDFNSSPCVTERKQQAKHKLGDVDAPRILVVKTEIESWYIAGVNENCCRRLKIPLLDATDNIAKEHFEHLLEQSKLGCTISCMVEMLKNYDIGIAKSKNSSFNYFYHKFLE